MAAQNGVVAHYLDGRVQKGTTSDFSPNRASFHLMTSSADGAIQIPVSQLKALFFVRDLAGDAQRVDPTGFMSGPAETIHGRKVAVRFRDGELLCGYSLSYSPKRESFFVFPADARSNNLRVFVNVAATAEVGLGTEADELVQRILDSRAA